MSSSIPRYLPSPPTPSPKKWVALLQFLYKYMDYGPMTAREMWERFNGDINNHIGIPSLSALQTRLHYMSVNKRGVYEFDSDIPYGAKKYMISISGLSQLKDRGLISEECERGARRRLLGIIEEVMPPGRYKRIINRLGRRVK